MSQLDEVDTVTRGRAYLDSLAGRRATVVGLARSGVAAARLLRAAGADVTGTDAKPLDALGREAAELRAIGVLLVTGGVPADAGAGADVVVVSPGVPVDHPALAAARARGVPVIGALLAEQPRPVLVAGNIGTPLAAHALTFPADGLVVCEVSSFQLETTAAFHPRVAAVLNVTPDHLDRHGSLAAYVNAKARIFANQSPADCAVLNADDEATRELAPKTRAHVVWFSRIRQLDHGVFVRDGWVAARLNGHVEEICPVGDIFLRGAHNVENVLAATACALWAGIAPGTIRRGIGKFRGVAHRIELVRAVGGVHYYNDSKGTNVASTLKALESFTEPVVLIAGGKGKGQDFAPLADAARGRVRHAIVIGEDGPRIAAALEAASIPVTAHPSLEAAVDAARRLAAPGDVVLLSPACASFDMFDNFEHRGDVFKKL